LIGPTLARLLDPRRLTPRDSRTVFDVLLAAGSHDAERCALLVALTARPAEGAEWAALAGEMRRRARPFRLAAMNLISGAVLMLSGIGLLAAAGLGLAGVRL